MADDLGHPVSTRSGRRDRITPVLVGITVVLAIAVGIVVYLAETKDEPGSGRSTSTQPVGVTPSASASEAQPSPAGPTYRCWNGIPSSSLTHCTDPTDQAAIGWIFPQERDALRYGTCHSRSGDARAVFIQCDLAWHGHVVHLHVSAWSGWLRARGHYDGGGAVREMSRRADGSTLIRWQPRRASVPFADAPWKVAEMLSGRPWTFAAYADDRATAQRALAEFGAIRDVREWRGVQR